MDMSKTKDKLCLNSKLNLKKYDTCRLRLHNKNRVEKLREWTRNKTKTIMVMSILSKEQFPLTGHVHNKMFSVEKEEDKRREKMEKRQVRLIARTTHSKPREQREKCMRVKMCIKDIRNVQCKRNVMHQERSQMFNVCSMFAVHVYVYAYVCESITYVRMFFADMAQCILQCWHRRVTISVVTKLARCFARSDRIHIRWSTAERLS